MNLEPQILAQLKEKLLSEKARLEGELLRIAKPTQAQGDYTTTFSEMGTGEEENASEMEEYTDNLSVEANLQAQLKDVLEALERMETGNYGKCENCNADIPVERLLAYPAAKKCLDC